MWKTHVGEGADWLKKPTLEEEEGELEKALTREAHRKEKYSTRGNS
jgi:hypothetical protein